LSEIAVLINVNLTRSLMVIGYSIVRNINCWH